MFDHNVSFPLNAKKKELVKIFEETIRSGEPASPKQTKPRDLVVIDVDTPNSPVLKSDIDSLVATPNDLTSTVKKSGQKRKLQAEKGNVFQVDSDSDEELLSPRKKAKKTSTPVRREKKDKKEKDAKAEKKEKSGKKEKDAKSEKKSRGKSQTLLELETSEKEAKLEVNDKKISEESPEAETPKPSRLKSPKARTPKIKSPEVSEISEISSSQAKSPGFSPKSPEVPPKYPISEPNTSRIKSPRVSLPNVSSTNSFQSAEDTAQDFDLALAKLKKEDEHFNENIRIETQDADLAKLLGIDVTRVKPKVRGRRVVSPRNPIIIPRRRLEYKEELSGSETDTVDEREEREQEVEKETAGDVESDSDLDSDEDEEGESDSQLTLDVDVKLTLSLTLKLTLTLTLTLTLNLKLKPSASLVGRKLLWAFFYIFSWSVLAGGALFTFWYREQTFLVGYCGHEIYKTTTPNNLDTPDWLVNVGAYLDENFRPECVECPQHARCFTNLEIGCYDDFVEFTPWYFNYMPVVDPHLKKCVPDTKKAEKIEIMIDVALDLLRSRNAHKNCGRTPPDNDEAGIEIGDLHDLLLAMKAPYITLEEFEELWERSVEELQKEPEIIVRQVTNFEHFNQDVILTHQVRSGAHHVDSAVDANHTAPATQATHKILRSTSLSHISLKCQLSNTAVSILVRFKAAMFVAVVVLLVAFAANLKYKQFKLQQHRIDTLYREVLSKLQRQARLAQESAELPAYIGSIQLRDLILSDESNLARKTRLWESVSRKVDRNSNVKHQLLEIHGEVMKVWQWISQIDEL